MLVQERLLFENLGVTTLVIAHRLATIVSMDKIFVIEDGRVLEEGSHSLLLQNGELYASMWAAQVNTTITE